MTPFLLNTKNNIHFACSAYPTVSFFTFEARNLIQIILDTYHVSTVFIGTTKTGWKKKHNFKTQKKVVMFKKKHSKKGVIIFPPWNYQLPFWKMMVCQFNTTFLFGAWQMFRGYVCFREIEIATFSVHVGLVSWWRVDLIYFDQSRRLWRKKWIGWAKA